MGYFLSRNVTLECSAQVLDTDEVRVYRERKQNVVFMKANGDDVFPIDLEDALESASKQPPTRPLESIE